MIKMCKIVINFDFHHLWIYIHLNERVFIIVTDVIDTVLGSITRYTFFFISKSFAKGSGLILGQKLSKLLSKSQPWFSDFQKKSVIFIPKLSKKCKFSQIKSTSFRLWRMYISLGLILSNVIHNYCKNVNFLKQISKQN